MVNTKTATLTLRIDPAIKAALRAAANKEHRSVANMVEVIVLAYCKQIGVAILNQRPWIDKAKKRAKHSR